MISVIIPTYNQPDALDLCLKSLFLGAKENVEAVVVVEGLSHLYLDILKKYREEYGDRLKTIIFKHNQGTPRAINYGVYNARFSTILIVNDDNVFPDEWDEQLRHTRVSSNERCVVTPNQIEPTPSIFRQFIIEDYGRDPKTFNLTEFWKNEKLKRRDYIDECGSTFPFMINKHDFLAVGGYPEDYPSKAGYVADWEFFAKCELVGMKMIRNYNLNFYHFVSLSQPSIEDYKKKQEEEKLCHEHYKYKWGVDSYTNPDTNSKVRRFHLM